MTKIHTPTARARLTPRREPYWHRIDVGRYVGYRAGADTWIARCYRPGHGNEYEALGTFAPAAAFTLAKEKAEAWFTTLDHGAIAHYTIEELIDDYVEDRRLRKGDASALEAKQLLHKSVLPKFSGRAVADITTAELKRWRNAIVPHGVDDETKRRAMETANRHWHTFRAALGLAFRDGKVADDSAWRRIQQFADVGRPRDFYPTPEQVADLLKHCNHAMRPLAHAGTLTGFRLQALTKALVSDFDAKAGTLNIKEDKGHKRVATLSSAAVELFKTQAKGKLPGAYLFTHHGGQPWKRSHQQRPFRDACNAARLPKGFVLYSLRHYFASRALLAGMNANALARNIGTSVLMLERHYGKFVQSDMRDMLDRVDVA